MENETKTVLPSESTVEESINPLIRLRGLVKSYKTVAGDFFALRGLDADIMPGEFIGVLGKSGAGKTTLVNMLTGVDRISSGEVWVGDVPVHQLNENQAARWRGRNMGVVFQTFQLMPTLSVLKNITLAMDFNGLFRGRASEKYALDLLREVELEDHAHKLPSAMSGGQQQRVAIARALANEPQVIVADEPTGRLDTSTAETIFQIFEKLVAQGKTVLMVTHDLSFAKRFTRILWLADGEIVQEPQFQLAIGD